MSLTKTLDNIFPDSIKSICDIESFPWHKDSSGVIDSYKHNSSQAIMLDVFGYLKSSVIKDRIINSVLKTNEKDWDIQFEVINPELLNEPRPTQIDVFLESNSSIIIVECKFTEKDGGSCSQTKKTKQGYRQCNGNYEPQINPINKLKSSCALAAKEIKYWDHIPHIYSYGQNNEYKPCPFKGGAYQWMRNLSFARAISLNKNKKAAFYLCYFDSPKFEIARKVEKGLISSLNEVIRDQWQIRAITFNKIIDTGINLNNKSGIEENWDGLKNWVVQKAEKCN